MAEGTASEEKLFVTLSAIGAIFGFVLPLVLWILKREEFSEYTKQFLKDVLNFELVLLIISMVLCFIPVLGWIANMALFVVNLIVVLRVFVAAQEQKEYSFPIKYQFIK
ncbi:MAG: DUF4870 domain-containing protein [Cyanobacteria bacterium RUI128]|nr:DUF4870 domain-containing protein [Cyanobacteria bacterium RUI128]